MDPGLILDAAKMVMLQYGLERLPDADGTFNLSVRDVVLLKLLRTEASQITLDDLREAIGRDGAMFQAMTFTEEALLDGQFSRLGYQFRSTRAHPRGHNARRADYLQLLGNWQSMPRPAIARFELTDVTLTASAMPVRIVNEGFGGDAALSIGTIEAPDWLRVVCDDHTLVLQNTITRPGVYKGAVTAHTTGGIAQLVVRSERLDFPMPTSDRVSIRSLMPDADGHDPAATQRRIISFLTELGFEILPGGLAVHLDPTQRQPEKIEVRLEPSYILQGELPLPHRVPASPRLYDQDGEAVEYDVRYADGYLTGLRDLFIDYEAKPDAYFVLRPMADGYHFHFDEAQPLREAHGYRYWILGTATGLSEAEQVHVLLRDWISEGEVNVLVSSWAETDFTRSLENLHASGTISVKVGVSSKAPVVIVEGEQEQGFDLTNGRIIELGVNPKFLWRNAEFLGGRDVREEAATLSESDGLTLPLSPEQRILATMLRPTPAISGASDEILDMLGLLRPDAPPPCSGRAERVGTEQWWFRDPNLSLRLLNLSNDYKSQSGYKQGTKRFLPAAPFLHHFDVTAEQLNYYDRGIKVTHGGWLGPDPEGLSSSEIAKAVVDLLDEPLHHSQLRQICEAFTGREFTPLQFLNVSRTACGWAGPGYRRRSIPGEPPGTNLRDVVLGLRRQGYLRRFEVLFVARKYLRTSPEKIGEVFDKLVLEAS